MSSQVVPQGYKQTKVGIVPKEWKEIVLSSFVNEKIVYCNDEKVDLGSLTIEKGVVPKPARYNREHLVKNTNDAYKLIKINDFAYNPMNLRFGALALYKNKQPLKVSAYYNIFNVNENIVNLDYIYAYLKSERIMFYYNRIATGSLEEKKRVHFKEFMKFIFPIPSMIEQLKIAEILTTWDNTILKQEELIKAKEELEKGLMQKLLSGEVRFCGFYDKWGNVRLSEVVNCFDNKRKPLNKLERQKMQGDIPYYGSTSIVDYINDYLFDEELILVSEDGGYFYDFQTKPIAFYIKGKSWINNHVHIIKNKDNTLDLKYLYYSLVHKNIIAFLNGGTRAKLNKKDLLLLKLKLPSLQEQQKIAQVLSNADKEIDLLKNELEELKKQKKGLMQKLLTGEVRVKI